MRLSGDAGPAAGAAAGTVDGDGLNCTPDVGLELIALGTERLAGLVAMIAGGEVARPLVANELPTAAGFVAGVASTMRIGSSAAALALVENDEAEVFGVVVVLVAGISVRMVSPSVGRDAEPGTEITGGELVGKVEVAAGGW